MPREIVINLVVHRDYRDSGNSIVKIFDDRIGFFNPGKLYAGLSIEQLQSGNYSSRTRNKAVARAFKEAGMIERYGLGISRIKNECKSHGVIVQNPNSSATVISKQLNVPLRTIQMIR